MKCFGNVFGSDRKFFLVAFAAFGALSVFDLLAGMGAAIVVFLGQMYLSRRE